MLNKLIVSLAVGVLGLALSGSAAATFHLYTINELYSNADGSVQFIKLTVDGFSGQNLLAGRTISASQGALTNSYTFPSDLPSAATQNTSVLIATQAFANLGIVTPDFIVPPGFLFAGSGTVNYADVDFWTYPALPIDGSLSLGRNGTTGVNSPKNFAGAMGTVPTPTTAAINFTSNWNLAGNGLSAPLDVVSTFGDKTKVFTVWKWVPSAANWAFYTPALSDGGAAYAAGKGYAFLSTIGSGEGFWVNAIIPFSVQLPAGTVVTSTSFQNLALGWTLDAVGDNPTPSQFTSALGISITSLWAWDATLLNWYFYAPSLVSAGTLTSYIASKGYLDFNTSSKTLGVGTGFWVNTPATSLSTTTTTTTTTTVSTTTTTLRAYYLY